MVASVLVYSVEEISGDGLIKLPFVAGVRAAFPEAKFSWCAASGNSVYDGWLKPVVAEVIDELILGEPMGSGLLDFLKPGKPFGGRRFDVVIDTQANVRRSLLVRRAAGRFISPAAGFALSAAKPAVWPDGLVERMQVLLSLAAQREAPLMPLPLADPRTREAAEGLLPAGPAYVGFAPGAGGAERRWPLENYIELARRQHARGRTPVFVLGPAEASYIDPLKHEAPFALLPQEDRTDTFMDISGPLLTIALAARFSGAVAADAGPGHMLAAGGSPLVSLFRERRKATKFRPAAPRVETLIAEDYGDKDISLIPVDAVDQALERLLSAP